MLDKLMNKPWLTRQAERDIRAMLLAHAADADPPAGAPAPPPATPVESVPPPVAEPPRQPEPDGRAIFEQRMAVLRSRQESEERRKVEQQAWQPTPASASWGGPSWSGGAGASQGTWGGVTTPQPPSEPQPPQPMQFHPTQLQSFQAQPFIPQQFVPGASTIGQPVAPPNYSGLCITALVLSLPFLGIPGGVALYFSQQVGQRYAAHDYTGAMTASGNAKTWAVVGIVLGALAVLGAAATG
jgi:hypothetical protein